MNEKHGSHHSDPEQPETDHADCKGGFILENPSETPMHGIALPN